ncbi:hypothetical protein LSAT2_009076 [Lamellibrachia satsuma]|nr:hypothetical protein LSAT2_009076 [Lamellibrachia satsuma]
MKKRKSKVLPSPGHRDQTENTLRQCDDKEFDFRRELCCGDQLYPRETGNESCCGWKLLDYTKEICCNEFVIDKLDKCDGNPLKRNRP